MCTPGEADRGEGTGGWAALVQVVLSFCTLVGCCTGSVVVRWFLGGEKSPDSFHSVMCVGNTWHTNHVQPYACRASALAANPPYMVWQPGVVIRDGVLLVLSAQLPIVVCTGLWGASGTWAAAKA